MNEQDHEALATFRARATSLNFGTSTALYGIAYALMLALKCWENSRA